VTTAIRRLQTVEIVGIVDREERVEGSGLL
jgi:hypothetical protein